MASKRKSWKEKLTDDKGLPRVVVLDKKMSRVWGRGTVVIPAPREVDELMRKVPKGKLITVNQIRDVLASRHEATIACPITTGIFARVAAGAAAEDEAQGKKRVTPYWRTLKSGGELNPKYPGGCEGQRLRLEAEGHKIVRRGERFFVEDHERHLAAIGQRTAGRN